MGFDFLQEKGDLFLPLPEVYQIEATNRCNLRCPMCLRTTDMVRGTDLLDPALLRLMNERGDFGGSYYVELQLAGEPTLHPQLDLLISILKDEVGVLAGLSTHGLLMRKRPELADTLLRLDALTVSVDSVEPETYHRLRFPAQLEDLLASLEVLLGRARVKVDEGAAIPLIDLQLIDTPIAGARGADVAALRALVEERGWSDLVSLRTTQDCFLMMQGRSAPIAKNELLCLNPFGSVSVTHTGDVVSCCYVFDPREGSPNCYGNLHEQSLLEVWRGARAQAMRAAHLQGQAPGQCADCYLLSPMRIHLNIVSRLVRRRAAGARSRLADRAV